MADLAGIKLHTKAALDLTMQALGEPTLDEQIAQLTAERDAARAERDVAQAQVVVLQAKIDNAKAALA